MILFGLICLATFHFYLSMLGERRYDLGEESQQLQVKSKVKGSLLPRECDNKVGAEVMCFVAMWSLKYVYT